MLGLQVKPVIEALEAEAKEKQREHGKTAPGKKTLQPTSAEVIEALEAEAKEKLEQGRKVGGENARRGRPNRVEPTSAQPYDRAPQVRDKIADMFDVGKEAGRGRPKPEPTSAQAIERAPQVRDKIADMFDVGKTTVSQGKKVMSESPLLAADVMNGQICLNEAYKQVKAKPKPPSEQKAKPEAKMLALKTQRGQGRP